MIQKVAVFAGTSEGKNLVSFLCENKIPCLVSSATEYGEKIILDSLFDSDSLIFSHTGCLNKDEIISFLVKNNAICVLDATHPFALEISKNVQSACSQTGIPYFRFTRENSKEIQNPNENIFYFKDFESAANELAKQEGNIFVSTGSKNLKELCAKIKNPARLFVRVLPIAQSLEVCNECKILPSHIIACQGPFSVQANMLMLKETSSQILLTKQSGTQGGFSEKLIAAKNLGIKTFVICAPEVSNAEQNKTLDQKKLLQKISELTNKKLFPAKKNLFVIGAGMGKSKTLTTDAKKIIQSADLLLGAKRFFEDDFFSAKQHLPLWQPEEIFSALEKFPLYKNIVLLVSGDTGFFSGAQLYLPFKEKLLSEYNCTLTFLPGISSMQFAASKLKIAYQEYVPCSLHGKTFPVVPLLRREKKIFLLLAGCDGVKKLGEIFLEAQKINLLSTLSITLCKNLSYADEKILSVTPEEMLVIQEDGLYCAFVEMLDSSKILLQPFCDSAFLRSDVPLTKQDIRSFVISKLALCKNDIFYDIGSGTGSVTIEAAFCSPFGAVFAFEQKEIAFSLTKKNCERFQVSNVTAVQGRTPQILDSFPAPNKTFIGGSDGELKKIIEAILKKNPQCRIVWTVILLEHLKDSLECAKNFFGENWTCSHIVTSSVEPLGKGHREGRENSIWIFCAQNMETSKNCN